MAKLELKIPPPAILILCGVFAWLTSVTVTTPLDGHGVVATILAILSMSVGIMLAASAILSFRRMETTIDPKKPDDASTLVTSGIYRFTRNPMYLALLLLLSGWVIYLGSIMGIAFLFIFVAYITRFQIRPEERILASIFGEAYFNYCGEVRRWI